MAMRAKKIYKERGSVSRSSDWAVTHCTKWSEAELCREGLGIKKELLGRS
jgi:hypothetical protein